MNKETKFEMDVVLKALDLYRKEAIKIELHAGLSGAMDDGGASIMRAFAMAFEDGFNKRIPPFLEPFVKQVNRENDPEYKKYLELKSRFE